MKNKTNTNQILQNVIEKITPPNEEKLAIDKTLIEFEAKLKPSLKGYGAKIFVGGSLAKQTLVKRDANYDIDIFILFPYARFKTKSLELSKLLEQAMKRAKIKYILLKGSRNYFQVKFKDLVLELIPILAIKKASEALNITDISPLHVSYVLGQIKKNRKLADEIKLAKAFCYAADCYGAESHIRGFSGYALEVLVSYYGSFLKFINNVAKWEMPINFETRIIIDPKRHYKNKKQLLEEMNEAKLHSPIVLVDPVQKERNACAALSHETLKKFIETAKKFLKGPRESYFFKEKIDIEKLRSIAKKSKAKFIILKAVSSKNKIDIAGAKLKKLYEFLYFLLKKNDFKILRSDFEFNEKTLEAKFYFILREPPKYYLVRGPPLSVQEKYISAFKKKWPNAFIKNKQLWVKAKREVSNVTQLLKTISKTQLREMGIKSIS
ncbi:MAG: hypothetical protein K6T16_01710 [Candidatus Pacearchaeota archaeon]|nr:hypothetical protein [Candidatus Pacearchaeota archaeon]